MALLFAVSSGFSPSSAAQPADYGEEMIRLTNSFNCGPIATYFFLVAKGKDISLADVRSAFGEESRVTSFAQILEAVGRFGVQAQGVKGDLEGLKSKGAFIAALKGEDGGDIFHFVVAMYDAKSGNVLIADPDRSSNVVSMTVSQFRDAFANRAIVAN